MKKLLATILFGLTLVLTGCATTPMATPEQDQAAKEFKAPADGYAGLYIYRDSFVGKALKKKVFVDDQFIGESAPDVYFYKAVKAGSHKISTESEFSNNDLNIETQSGKNYFVRQYIKMGVFVGGANLEKIDEEKGKAAVKKLKLAVTH